LSEQRERKLQNDCKGLFGPNINWTTEPKSKIVNGIMVMVNGTVADAEFLSVLKFYKTNLE